MFIRRITSLSRPTTTTSFRRTNYQKIGTTKSFRADIAVESGIFTDAGRRLVSISYEKDAAKAVALSSGIYGKTSGTFNIKFPLVSGLSGEVLDSLPLKVQQFKQKYPKLLGKINTLISKVTKENDKDILVVTGVFPMAVAMLVNTSLNAGSLIDLNFKVHSDTSKPPPCYKIAFQIEVPKQSIELAKTRLSQTPQANNNPQMELILKIMSKTSLFKQQYHFDTMADLFEVPEIPRLLFGDLYEKNMVVRKLIREVLIDGNTKGLSKMVEDEIKKNGIVDEYLEWTKIIENITQVAIVFSENIFDMSFELPPLLTYMPSEIKTE